MCLLGAAVVGPGKNMYFIHGLFLFVYPYNLCFQRFKVMGFSFFVFQALYLT